MNSPGSRKPEAGSRRLVTVQAKTGATIAPVFGGTRQLALLAALFLPALSSFLCHLLLSPPSCGIRLRRAFTVSPRCCLQARQRCACRRSTLRCVTRARPSRGRSASLFRCPLFRVIRGPWVWIRVARGRGVRRPKKSGVQSRPSHPPVRSAALSASCRPFSCRPLRISSPCVPPWNKAAQLVTGDPGITTGGLSAPPSYKM